LFKNTAIITMCAGLFLVLLITLVMHLLEGESLLGSVSVWSMFKGGDDSWEPMKKALALLGQSPAGLLYDELFFRQRVKFQYPLTSLLFMSGLTPFFGPGTVAAAKGIAWAAVPLTVFAAGFFCMLLLKRVFAKLPKWEVIAIGVLTMAATMIFYPIVKAFDLGQIQTWVNALFALSCVCWAVNSRRTAGVCIGLICLIKPQFSLFLLWGLVRRQWRFLQGWAAVIVAGGITSIALYGFWNNLNYLKVLQVLSRHGESFYPNHSLNGLLNRMFFNGPNLAWAGDALPDFNPFVYGATLASSALLILLALFWRRQFATPESPSMPVFLDYVGAALTFTMASPIAWEHHYGILPPVFIVAFVSMASFADARLRARLLLLLAVSYGLAASYLPVTKSLAATPFNFVQSYLFFGALILLGVVYWLRERLPKERLLNSAAKSFFGQQAGRGRSRA
jgi:alpha-1,2-mannosyltransferase